MQVLFPPAWQQATPAPCPSRPHAAAAPQQGTFKQRSRRVGPLQASSAAAGPSCIDLGQHGLQAVQQGPAAAAAAAATGHSSIHLSSSSSGCSLHSSSRGVQGPPLLGRCSRAGAVSAAAGGVARRSSRLAAVSSSSQLAVSSSNAAADEKIWVPFKPDFFSSQPVSIQGSFNDWSEPIVLNHDPAAGKVGGVVQLDAKHGVVSFKYQVGDQWMLSREDAAASDDQGCINNTTAGRQTVTFKFPGAIVPSQQQAPGYEVHVCGSFTDWQVSVPLAQGPDGDYYAKLALTPGHHTFMYLLDATAGISSSSSSMGGKDPGGLPISLVPSPRSPQVERRARWVVVDWLHKETVPGGTMVNSVDVPKPPTFKILYHTPFKEAHLHYRFKGQPNFGRIRMYHQPDASGLMVAQIPAPDMSCQLEFSVTGTTSGDSTGSNSTLSSSSDEDSSDVWTAAHLGTSCNSSGGGGHNNSNSNNGQQQQQVVRDPPALDQLYTAPHPGVWRLREQQLGLDAAGQLAPLMLCTDLDGTLIEDSGEESDFIRTADEQTRRARSYFGQYLAPSGGVLVFNTGRSIGMVEGLLAKKKGIMPWPHAIITAVGTKAFLWDVAEERWVPDPGYSLLLDEGWDAEKVSRTANDIRNRYNGQVAVVDDGTEHPHRLSLTMRGEISDRATQKWSEALTQAGVKHQMVASIGGDWRYVDCISLHAGKGRAMMYLASRYGVTPQDVVAAGDSGNDLLMLGPVDGAGHPAIIMSNSHPEVWDWFNSIAPAERAWVYTPKGERAAGIVEGLKAIVAEKLTAKSKALQELQAKMRALPQQRQQQQTQQPGGSSGSGSGSSRSVKMVRS